MPRRFLRVLFLLTAPTCAALVAQAGPPSPQDLARTATDLARQLDDLHAIAKPTDADKAALEKARQLLSDLVASLTKSDGQLSEDHYVQASSPLLAGHPAEGLAISEAGLKSFPEARFLLDHVGFAKTALANRMQPCAAQLVLLRAAEAAFRKALTCKPDTWHAHAGLYQVLDQLGQCGEARQQLELVANDDEGKQSLNLLWSRRASLLMRDGKAQDAVKLLREAKVEDDEQALRLVMLVRATALAGDAAATQTAIKAMRDAESSPRTLLEAADALAYLGKKADALKLLAARPATASFQTEEEREAQVYAASGAAMEAFLKATDCSPAGPLRAALTKALDHHFLFADGGKQVDLASSPVLMSKLLQDMPPREERIKDWGNHTLFVLSVRAAAAYKPGPAEQKLMGYLKGSALPTVDDVEARLLALRCNAGLPDACGALMGLRAAEKLEQKAAPAPASPPARK